LQGAIFIPTRGFIAADVISRLNEEELPYSIMTGSVSWSNTMNRAVEAFLSTPADVFLTIDDDTIPPLGWVDSLVNPIAEGQFDIMGGVALIAKPGSIFLPNTYEKGDGDTDEFIHSFGNGIQEVDAVGSACLAVSRKVLEEVKAPFLESFHENGTIDLGGDIRFCTRAKEAGFKVGANFDVLCEHYRPIHLNAAADAYLNLSYGES
jgi:GT2 family glycosyltransferase